MSFGQMQVSIFWRIEPHLNWAQLKDFLTNCWSAYSIQNDRQFCIHSFFMKIHLVFKPQKNLFKCLLVCAYTLKLFYKKQSRFLVVKNLQFIIWPGWACLWNWFSLTYRLNTPECLKYWDFIAFRTSHQSYTSVAHDLSSFESLNATNLDLIWNAYQVEMKRKPLLMKRHRVAFIFLFTSQFTVLNNHFCALDTSLITLYFNSI